MDSAAPPCDFDLFVAQNREISVEQAQRLVQCWLKNYRPRTERDAKLQETTRDTA